MDGVKKWYASRGVLGALATMALGLASAFGLIGESDAQAIQSAGERSAGQRRHADRGRGQPVGAHRRLAQAGSVSR